jgi:hypothetical protein
MPMIIVKKVLRNFQLYATIAYAVRAEKYTLSRVEKTEITTEFIKPCSGLKVLPVNTSKLFIRKLEGISETALC